MRLNFAIENKSALALRPRHYVCFKNLRNAGALENVKKRMTNKGAYEQVAELCKNLKAIQTMLVAQTAK